MDVGLFVGAVLVLSPDSLPVVEIRVNNEGCDSGEGEAI